METAFGLACKPQDIVQGFANYFYEAVMKIRRKTQSQSGFHPLHSTGTCLIDTTNKLLLNIDRGLFTGMVFLDLSKAFDTLDHERMWEKLSQIGFNESAVVWFDDYLTNRTQSIALNCVVSDPQSLMYGVPQGPILGPLLFIIYINELPSIIQNCSIQLYADDTLLFFSSSSVALIESTLSERSSVNICASFLRTLNYCRSFSSLSIQYGGLSRRLARL